MRNKSKKIFGTKDRPRITVFAGLKNIYAQMIDDNQGRTLVSASTLEKEVKSGGKPGANIETAKKIGALLGKKAVAAGIKEAVFDRGKKRYHGKLKALADAARQAGLKF